MASASRILLLAAAAGAGARQAPLLSGRRLSGPACHADVLVKNLDFGGMAAYERTMLSPELAKALAMQNGISAQAVSTPDARPGNVGFFRGSYVAPWAPSRPPYTGGHSTIISALIGGCDEPTATLAIFRTPAAHRAIEETIQQTIGGSSAIEGKPEVLGVAVAPATADGSAAPAPAPSPPAAAPTPLAAAVPPVAPPAATAAPPPPADPTAAAMAPPTAAPGSSSQEGQSMTPFAGQIDSSSPRTWAMFGGGSLAAVALGVVCCIMVTRPTKKSKRSYGEGGSDDLLSDSDASGH